ncbi:hypothetical protein HPB48_014094 [Haemaphysalis longicornis]|uniref:Uncharacterized protein n=1 Tax=Haemaphysalis longicornis TaxID=44386 RepID=A0A9J6FMA0_HAELO|nr:hypothetical protein HPB48_014094 [Haemaphysalis longicornis]
MQSEQTLTFKGESCQVRWETKKGMFNGTVCANEDNLEYVAALARRWQVCEVTALEEPEDIAVQLRL